MKHPEAEVRYESFCEVVKGESKGFQHKDFVLHIFIFPTLSKKIKSGNGRKLFCFVSDFSKLQCLLEQC